MIGSVRGRYCRVAGVGVCVLAVALELAGAGLAAASAAGAPSLVRVNLCAGGHQADAGLYDKPSISADGRFVAFASPTTNLIHSVRDTNGYSDIFVHDRKIGTSRRVSVASSGAQANGASFAPVISADGRYIAFDSYASNLTAGDRNSATGGQDVFVHSTLTGRTVRISTPNGGGSADGESGFPSISADGRYVAYDSTATNLVAADTNARGDVFVWDRDARVGRTARVSLGLLGQQANGGSGLASISADGRKVAFVSSATNLVPLDTNHHPDVFVRDQSTALTLRASVRADGRENQAPAFDPAISPDGTHVAFHTAWPLTDVDTDYTTDVYLRDLRGMAITMVSSRRAGSNDKIVRGESYGASVGAGGRYVAFTSYAGDLLAGDTNGHNEVYVRDTSTGQLRRVAMTATGQQADQQSYGASITADGRHLAFGSGAQNLVEHDFNQADDVFVLDAGGSTYAQLRPAAAPKDTWAPDTAITDGPLGTVRSTSATFRFTSNEPRVRLQCKLDERRWKPCSSPHTWTKLANGRHTLSVRAIDVVGNLDDSPATRVWTQGDPRARA